MCSIHRRKSRFYALHFHAILNVMSPHSYSRCSSKLLRDSVDIQPFLRAFILFSHSFNLDVEVSESIAWKTGAHVIYCNELLLLSSSSSSSHTVCFHRTHTQLEIMIKSKIYLLKKCICHGNSEHRLQ